MAPSCSVLHCPTACTCSNNIVDCRGKGLTEIPTNLPETITEMCVILLFLYKLAETIFFPMYSFLLIVKIHALYRVEILECTFRYKRNMQVMKIFKIFMLCYELVLYFFYLSRLSEKSLCLQISAYFRKSMHSAWEGCTDCFHYLMGYILPFLLVYCTSVCIEEEKYCKKEVQSMSQTLSTIFLLLATRANRWSVVTDTGRLTFV